MQRLLAQWIVFIAVGLLIAPLAHAESVVWSQVQPDLMMPGGGNNERATTYLYDAMVSITYKVAVSEVDATGNKIRVLSDGAQVLPGTRILYEFVPHEYTDVYWVGTGSSWDSPYGAWMAGAASPPIATRCAAKNLYMANIPANTSEKDYIDLFADLAVDPPSKQLGVTGASCETRPNGIDKICTAGENGTISAQFVFQSTTGKFYPGYRGIPGKSEKKHQATGDACGSTTVTYGEQSPMKLTLSDNQTGRFLLSQKKGYGADFTMPVPQQTIPVTLTVTEEPEEEEPTATSTPPTNPTQPSLSASGGAACVVGQPYSIGMSSTDPEGDAVKFHVDWNGDGSIDLTVPGSGFVPSGTSLTTSRTFATSGSKTVKVRAQDEDGTLSPWATFTFSCAGSSEAGLEGNGNNNENNGNGGPNLPPSADLQIRAIPSLVRSGNTTKVNWSATNVESCTVQGTNGDSWTGLSSPVGGETSSAINGETRYTLRCIDLQGAQQTRQATVRVLPSWRER